MNREIKFRARRVHGGEWAYGLPAYYTSKNTNEIRGIEFSPDSVDGVLPETVGQFTGLKDKRGVEVYEGDIVEPVQPGYAKNMVVFFCMESCSFKAKNQDHESAFPLGNYTHWLKVVGNIHENPELL